MIELPSTQFPEDIGKFLQKVVDDPNNSEDSKTRIPDVQAILVVVDKGSLFRDRKIYARCYLHLTPEEVKPILDRYTPKYLDGAIKRIRDGIQWSKTRVVEEEAELERLLKLKEQYK